MSKQNIPFICKRLGVTVGEEFYIKEFHYNGKPVPYRINLDGTYTTTPTIVSSSTLKFLQAIENPALIEKAPLKLLEDDIALIKMFERNTHPFDTIVFGKDEDGPYWIEDRHSISEKKHYLPVGFLSNIPQGTSFTSRKINKNESK